MYLTNADVIRNVFGPQIVLRDLLQPLSQTFSVFRKAKHTDLVAITAAFAFVVIASAADDRALSDHFLQYVTKPIELYHLLNKSCPLHRSIRNLTQSLYNASHSKMTNPLHILVCLNR